MDTNALKSTIARLLPDNTSRLISPYRLREAFGYVADSIAAGVNVANTVIAEAVTYSNATSSLVATNVQAAIDELKAKFSNISTDTLATVGIITPSQLTVNTDNWNPVGIGASTIIRASSDSARDITGLQGGTTGRIMSLQNIGTNSITLKHDVTSTPAYRFICPNSQDYVLKPNSSCLISYDATSSRWRVISDPSSTDAPTHPGYAANRYYWGTQWIGISVTTSIYQNTLLALPLHIGAAATFTKIGIDVTTAVAGSTISLGIYNVSGGFPTTKIIDASVSGATTGQKEATISWPATPGTYALVVNATHSSILVSGQSQIIQYWGTDTYNGSGNMGVCLVAGGIVGLPASWSGGSFSNENPRMWLRV